MWWKIISIKLIKISPKHYKFLYDLLTERKPFENREVSLDDGNDIQTKECSLPPARGGGVIIDGESTEEKVDKLIEKLKTEAKVLWVQ